MSPATHLQTAPGVAPAWLRLCRFYRNCSVPEATLHLHCRSPLLWDRPDEFDPDRFGPIEGPAPNEVTEDFKYLPFGGGKRKCIGEGGWGTSSHLALVGDG